MALTPGTRLGVYEVTAPIGSGGMGEVYRATDSNLKRSVAIKVLPVSVARDADRLARFQREAEVLAALNHPNIGAIYGFERTPNFTALVMELVEGDDLSQRIARGAIPIDEALPIAKQIAEALEAAHEQGIIHRDLKPANIKVRADGTVKVLDFGLAKAMEPTDALSASATMSPTITTPAMTQAGMILGTAAYMSPEQAKGRTVDRRADVWAFGAVLYEMLMGRRLFDAEDISETLAAVLTRDVSLTSLPAAIPLRLRALMRDCLIRDPKQRLRDIGDARLVIDRMIAGAPDDTVAPANASAVIGPSRIRERWAWAATSLILASVAAWLGVGMFARGAVPNPVAHRLLLPLPDKVSLDSTLIAPLRLAVAPDGQRVAFIATTGGHPPTLWVQSLTDSSAHELKGTDGGLGPRWSADSTRLSVLVGGALKAVDADTGTLTDLGPIGVGIWGPGTSMIGSRGGEEWTVLYLSAPGATPRVLLKPSSPGEIFRAMAILPDGQHFLVTHRVSRTAVRLEVGSLSGGERPVLLDYPDLGSVQAASGALVYSRGDRLFAQPFDAGRIRLSGQPTVIGEHVDVTAGFGAAFSVSANGVLVYSGGREARSIVYVSNESGRPEVYVISREGGGKAQLSTGGGTFPRWRRDGREILYLSPDQKLMSVAVSGSGRTFQAGATTSLFTMNVQPGAGTPFDVTADGQRFIVNAKIPSRLPPSLNVVVNWPALLPKP